MLFFLAFLNQDQTPRRKPLTETQRHGENFSAGTPTSSSASALHSDETTATPPNPIRQNTVPILALAEFKRLLNAIKYQEFVPLSLSRCRAGR